MRARPGGTGIDLHGPGIELHGTGINSRYGKTHGLPQTTRISLATRAQPNFLSAKARPFSPICWHKTGSSKRDSELFCEFPRGPPAFSTTNPLPLMTSGFPPRLVVTMGSPQAMASQRTRARGFLPLGGTDENIARPIPVVNLFRCHKFRGYHRHPGTLGQGLEVGDIGGSSCSPRTIYSPTSTSPSL